MLMLAPYGISLPTFARAVRAKRAGEVPRLADLHVDGYTPNLNMGGTIVISTPVIRVDPSRTIR
jgi:hypothetical protein